MLDLIVVALALGAAGAAAGAALARRRRRRRAEALASRGPAERRLERGELRAGDVVAYLGSSYLVEALAELDEGAGPSVVLAETAGDEGRRWLVVEPGRAGVEPLLAARGEPLGLGGELPSWLHDEGGVELRLVRRLGARLRLAGQVEGVSEGPCQLGRYEGPGGRGGLVLVSGAGELVLVGRAVTAEGLVLMQGGDLRRGPEQ